MLLLPTGSSSSQFSIGDRDSDATPTTRDGRSLKLMLGFFWYILADVPATSSRARASPSKRFIIAFLASPGSFDSRRSISYESRMAGVVLVGDGSTCRKGLEGRKTTKSSPVSDVTGELVKSCSVRASAALVVLIELLRKRENKPRGLRGPRFVECGRRTRTLRVLGGGIVVGSS